jgi:Omp85 superfamily domain
LGVLYAPAREAFRIKYSGNFTKAVFKNDLLLRAELVHPTNNNFFGFGNKTVFDKNQPVEYYRVRYKYLETDVLLKKKMGRMIEMSVGPTYYRYWSDPKDNSKRIMDNPAIIGGDSADVYSTKQYLGAKAKFDINYVNNELFPTRGMTWYTELSPIYGIGSNAKNIVRFTTDASIYASLSDDARTGAIFRLGAGHIWGKNYEYFQALSLGAHNVLRGYRKNRFSGSSLMYASTEIRVRLFKSQSYLLPGDVGIMSFYDLGRVWHKGEESRKWHGAYGAGLYFMPYGLSMMSFTVGFSPEDRLFNFSLGTKFKLVY